MMLIWLVFLPIVSLLLKHFLFGNDHQLPPGPSIWHVLVNLKSFINTPHVAFNNVAKIYGPLSSVRMGSQLYVVVSSPATAREILRHRNLSGRFFPSAYYDLPGITPATILASKECNDSWKSMRAIGQSSIFSSAAVESTVHSRKTKVMEMVKYLRTKEGQIINVENVILSTFANIVTNVLVSKDLFDTGKIDGKVMEMINEVTELLTTPGLGDIFPILKGVDVWSKRNVADAFKNVELVWGEIVKDRRANGINPNSTRDFLDVLFENKLSDYEIFLLLTELLTAGTDTTATTMGWIMVELMKNQDILYKIRDEIANKAIKGNSIDDSCLSECEYLNACIKEGLRVHIPGPLAVPRRAVETCRVNNYVIPKDSVVLLNLVAILTDPGSWEDPSSFKPERFLDDSKADFKGTNSAYIPFGAGQRNCPGINVAVKGAQVMLASLAYYFDWSLPDGVDSTTLGTNVKFGTTLKMEKPLCLIPRIREH